MFVANLSGGRDSTAMVIKWLELKKPLDYIIFCDTGFEFVEMYEYIDKLDNYLQKHFNKKITRLDASKEIERWAFEYPITKGVRQGRLRGLPMILSRDYCTRETKIKPTQQFVKTKSPNKFKNSVLIGYTYNEVKKGRNSNLSYGVSVYPLYEWGWNEKEVNDFLEEKGIMNPLYNHFERTGCFFCPKQSTKSFYMLFKHYKKEWELMKEWEQRAKELNCVNQKWLLKYTLNELETKFKDKANVLFEIEEINFGYFETCFCKG
ncbi:phosphoadenosine phosphosulfate reductase family protein [Campylobacter troglodytis]|uniref:phosphoadenosine phosphosulfate reductase domain-containing protein n=1 Tax=Campylobacter troglodytis TaxID=654363 RepID=UPI0011576297|nr:phosphoadenosine phosphosulfate reductase family protein [Campylobacter troglodytis]TQR55559.1 hypothetical protein DMC01_09735 [Campylobacter troglodytis]